MGPKTKNK